MQRKIIPNYFLRLLYFPDPNIGEVIDKVTELVRVGLNCGK